MNQMAKKSLKIVKSVSAYFKEYISIEDYGSFLLIRANDEIVSKADALSTSNKK
ncbi:hypothetical protein J2127_000086 [Methanococcus voltae]|uniref:hypothetical protein n=1 Tax=Methanococcus voltae TaxID=2188 RepID=UPI001AEA3615|nr:hypothetical protein [Methanococcus voltae]MBP2142945.1 hypothetical protein [Methanococcus voltae]